VGRPHQTRGIGGEVLLRPHLMPTALKTWARLRAPVLCITGTGAGVGVPLAKGGRVFISGVATDTYNVVYEGPVFLSDQKTMMRTDFNPSNITGTTSLPAAVRSPYFTANSPFFDGPGNFIEWSSGGSVPTQTLTEDQKGQLIGQTVTTTTTFFVMTSAAFNLSGQGYTPGYEDIVEIGNLTLV